MSDTITAERRAGLSADETRRRKRRRLIPFLYVLPALLVVVGVIYFGIGYNVYVSTLDWNGISTTKKQVGFGNFITLVQDPTVWAGLEHVAIFAVIAIFVQMALAIILALIFNGPVAGKAIYRAIVFIPVVMAPTAIATAFRQFYAYTGQLNEFLSAIGLGQLQQMWLA